MKKNLITVLLVLSILAIAFSGSAKSLEQLQKEGAELLEEYEKNKQTLKLIEEYKTLKEKLEKPVAESNTPKKEPKMLKIPEMIEEPKKEDKPVAKVSPKALDLNSMSVKELKQLKADIEAELLSRGAEKVMEIPVGSYVIGVDIPAGVYSVELSAGLQFPFAMIYLHKEERLHHIAPEAGVEKIGKLVLENGEKIEVSGCPILLKPYKGLGF